MFCFCLACPCCTEGLRGGKKDITMQIHWADMPQVRWHATLSRRLEWLLHSDRNSLWVITHLPFGWLLLAWSPKLLFFSFFLALPPRSQDGIGLQHNLLLLLPTPKHSRSQTQAVGGGSLGPSTTAPVSFALTFSPVLRVWWSKQTPLPVAEKLQNEREHLELINLPRAQLPQAEQVSFLVMLLGRAWASLKDPQPHTQNQLLTNHSIKTTPAAVSHKLLFQHVIWKPRAVLGRRGRSHLHAGKQQTSLCSPLAAVQTSPVPHGNGGIVGNVDVGI